MTRLTPLLVLLLALAIPAAALAARQPTNAERAAITKVMGVKGVPRSCFPLTIAVSTRNSRFAVATYRGVKACGIVVGNGQSIVKRVAYKKWRIVETGSSLDCKGDVRVPPAVLQDLLGYC
ncbi:MAG: hypothetical protein QOD85_1980 [Gaiellaceae bacterium]|nr:hypothetical protein [Gaiellaceae bacterium]